MAVMYGSGTLYVDGVAVGLVEGGEVTYSADELRRPVAVTVTVSNFTAETVPLYLPTHRPFAGQASHIGHGSPDATRGASVDDLIDNIDAVLESYRSDT